MRIVLYAIIHGAVAVSMVACVVRGLAYSLLPMHLRWELYPVPHEAPQRVRHGGSYFEEGEWWSKPPTVHRLGELRVMIPEMLFMRGLWEFNRSLWLRSFPFHFGLYLLLGTLGLVLLTGLLERFAPSLIIGHPGTGLRWLYKTTGFVGLVLALFGALALLLRRLTTEDLRAYTTAADIFNLCAFTVTLGCLLGGLLLRGPDSPNAVGLVRAILTFDSGREVPTLLVVGLTLSALLAAYIPFTHMIHFVAKYFTYHAIRWDDRPNQPGGSVERKMAEYLTYRPTWAARHVGADGSKTWADVAGSNPAGGEKK